MLPDRTFLEFFAGGGMARHGLGRRWRCLMANDFDPLKAEVYEANWGKDDFTDGDVALLDVRAIKQADLAWASSPCQDVSAAGRRGGLGGAKSSAFWSFWLKMRQLSEDGNLPRTIVIENVSDLLISNNRRDIAEICSALYEQGYWFGAVEIDAVRFVPQSRLRMFLVASLQKPPELLVSLDAMLPQHTKRVRAAYCHLDPQVRRKWVWWSLPLPPSNRPQIEDILEESDDLVWMSENEVSDWISLLSPLHQGKLKDAGARQTSVVGTVVRRMRTEEGKKVQRAELRFDGQAQCLRVPRGGSSSQRLVMVTGSNVRMRALTVTEGKRLMGLPDDYKLPSARTAAFSVLGDGVAVPVVRYIEEHLLQPLLEGVLSHGDKEGGKLENARCN